jgi:hypothetical protein
MAGPEKNTSGSYMSDVCTVTGGKFKFSAQDSDLAHSFELNQTCWQKAAFIAEV